MRHDCCLQPHAVVLYTSRLFQKLLRVLRIDTACDIGSRDGLDAAKFRAVLPDARVVAFEPNPGNHDAMRNNPALARANIEIQPMACAESDGEAEFFVVPADYTTAHPGRGLSSLYQRPTQRYDQAPVPVRVTRLDTFFAQRRRDMRVALWIDVEGKGHEVLEGADGILDAVQLAHIEVETQPLIAPNQRLYTDVQRLLHARGFVEIAESPPLMPGQLNVVFVPRRLATDLRVRWWLALLRIRYLASQAKSRLLPG
jgi:FkbM family methyltransferase